MVVDIHAHAFPDFLAEKALQHLADRSGPYSPVIGGTVADLYASMDLAGVDISCIANIATRPEQTAKIIEWSASVTSPRIIPLGSVYPASGSWEAELEMLVKAGVPGLKLHPLYQGFRVDDTSLIPFFEAVAAKGLFILFHAGYDIAYGDDDSASPQRMMTLRRAVPALTMVAAHLGGWHDWDNVYELIAGQDIFLDTSFIHEVDAGVMGKILSKHSRERVVFGSDSPWVSQKDSLASVDALPIDDDYRDKIRGSNMMKYLIKPH